MLRHLQSLVFAVEFLFVLSLGSIHIGIVPTFHTQKSINTDERKKRKQWKCKLLTDDQQQSAVGHCAVVLRIPRAGFVLYSRVARWYFICPSTLMQGIAFYRSFTSVSFQLNVLLYDSIRATRRDGATKGRARQFFSGQKNIVVRILPHFFLKIPSP